MTEGVGGACGGGGGSSISLPGRGAADGGGGGGGWAELGQAADAGPPDPRQAAGAGPGPSGQLLPLRSAGGELGVLPEPRPRDHGEWYDQGRGPRWRSPSLATPSPGRAPASDLLALAVCVCVFLRLPGTLRADFMSL